MRIEIVEDSAELTRLEAEWNELLSESASDCVFLTYEWLSTWWRHFQQDRRLFVVTMRQGDRLVAIAPFVRGGWRLNPPRVTAALEFMGDRVGSEYLDVIVRRGFEGEAVDRLCDLMCERGLLLDLPQVRDGDTTVRRLQSRLAGRRWTGGSTVTGPCPYISLTGQTWDSYLGTLGSQHRANVRRRLRDVSKHFTTTFEAVSVEADRTPALTTLIELHNTRWKDRGGSQAFSTEAHLEFHEDVTRTLLSRGWLRLYTLQLDGKAVAALYGVVYNRTFYFYQSGFDPAYSRHSVGLVTMGSAIREAIREGIEEFDMLYGLETYKTLWAAASRPLLAFECVPPNLRGRIHRTSLGARQVVRSVRRTLKGFQRPAATAPAPEASFAPEAEKAGSAL